MTRGEGEESSNLLNTRSNSDLAPIFDNSLFTSQRSVSTSLDAAVSVPMPVVSIELGCLESHADGSLIACTSSPSRHLFEGSILQPRPASC